MTQRRRPPALLVKAVTAVAAVTAATTLALLGGCSRGSDEPTPQSSASTTADPSEEATERGTDDGDDERLAPDEWSSTVCTGVSNYREEMTSLTNDFRPPADPGAGKELLITYLDGTLDATDNLVRVVGEAGTPDLPDGRTVADGYLQNLEQARMTIEDARGDAETLDTDDPVEFARVVQSAGGAVAQGSEAVVQTVRDVRSPDLEAAMRAQPECRGVLQ